MFNVKLWLEDELNKETNINISTFENIPLALFSIKSNGNVQFYVTYQISRMIF